MKLGGDYDYEFINTIRKYTDKPICVDVNEGWKVKEVALEKLHFLHQENTLFVEQPIPKANHDDQLWLFKNSPIPLFADESVQKAEDIKLLINSFHGVNIKLMKSGGIQPALEMVTIARECNLKVMIGCMSETGCSVKAASQISSLADYADLDGPLLSKNNPFDIVEYKNGCVIIN